MNNMGDCVLWPYSSNLLARLSARSLLLGPCAETSLTAKRGRKTIKYLAMDFMIPIWLYRSFNGLTNRDILMVGNNLGSTWWIVKYNEILILDEATSSLDSASEQYVQHTIDLLVKQHKTIIVIAHRLTTVRKANTIIVLDKGQVIEEGNHIEMLLARGHYFNLWQHQFAIS